MTNLELVRNDNALVNPDFASDKCKTGFITLEQLIARKQKGELSCNHLRQRISSSWTNEQINKMLSWVCNGMPLPGIYICEQVYNLMKRSFIIDGGHRTRNLEKFLTDDITIKKNGAERTLVTYKNYILDENGNKVFDDYGCAKFELAQFDIIGKKFSEFPEDLKDRIKSYNIGTTTFLNCTDEDVAYYMRNYNNHTQMNQIQKGMTYVEEEFASVLKSLSNHDFFKDCTSISLRSRDNGAAIRAVVESLIVANCLDDWKAGYNKNLVIAQNNITQGQYVKFEEELDRLCEIIGEDEKRFFNLKDTFLMLALFHEFTSYGIDDDKFIDFLNEFESNLHEMEIDGECFDAIPKEGTKQKKVIERKLSVLRKLLAYYVENFCDADDTSDDVEDIEDNVTDYESETVELSDAEAEVVNYLQCSDVATFLGYEDGFDEATNIGLRTFKINYENTNSVSNAQDTEYYIDVLGDYLYRSVANDTGFVSLENIPALIKLTKIFADTNTDEKYILKWFARYNELYSKNCMEFIGKDDVEKYSIMLKDWNAYYSMCLDKKSA